MCHPRTSASRSTLDDLVQFHTAVLGMTGTGKTELALDIVREAIKNDFKVFCVDFTGEYKARLADLSPIVPSPPSKSTTSTRSYLLSKLGNMAPSRKRPR